jgi:hypothetical protein
MNVIEFKTNQSNVTLPTDLVVQQLIEQLKRPVQQTGIALPKIGEYLEGQGGIYVGEIRGEDGALYGLVMSQEQDLGKAQWGYENQKLELSRGDGAGNARQLGNSPAVQLAVTYTADGHTDFYLPSRHELTLASVNVPEHFNKDGWYWTSTPQGEYSAWAVGFEYGLVFCYFRYHEFRVRPFRRFAL